MLRNRNRYSRWGRIEDRSAYEVFRNYLNETDLTVEEVFRKPKSKRATLFLESLGKQCGWKRELIYFEQRLKKLNDLKTFSVREMKLLRRTIRRQKKVGEIDWDQVLYNFPGKTMDMIQEAYFHDRNMKMRKKRTTSKNAGAEAAPAQV